MAVQVGVDLNPNTKKVDAALARIKAQAKGIDFGGGAKSINKLSRPLGKITGQATEFQKSLEASNARVLAFGASVAVINKLSQAFGALVQNTIKVEASFAKINTILGGTQKQLEQFGNGIFKVAQNTATSFDQVAEGALELARQGLGVEESLSRVETALKLVRVAGIDSQQAVAGLTAAIKGFEGSGLTVANIADKLAEVDTKFAVSTEDLINGLERASASARVAGVSFDELLGVVTTVQERTQRGGAVIGNAFKTIFARLGRTDTLVALEELGIRVLDSQGNVRSAIPLFQELAVELNKLGLQSVEAGEIIQKVAGVRQRDILISLVEDLNSSQSQFAKSLEVSANAAGALDSKNAKLNDTLEALINNLTVGAQKLSSVIGELGFTDAAKDILKIFSSIVNGITDLLQGDSMGAKFAQGIIKGIGSVLTGPGLALISAIFIKLFIDLAKFGTSSLKQILGINKATQAQNTLQQSVLQTLLQNESIQREILALEGNKVAQEQLLLKIYNQQAAALARVQKAAAAVTPGLFGAGLRGGEKGVTRRGAGGYVAAEARDVSRGVGGAPASAKVVSIPNFAFGGGKRGTMVANTSEYFVPNYAGGGDAIFNQNMVKSMGLPAGAKKINAAGGFIPNFSRSKRAGASLPDDNTFKNLSLSELERKNPASLKGKALTDYNAALAVNRKGKKVSSNFNFNANKKIGVLSAFKGSSSTIATQKFGELSSTEKTIFESIVGQEIKKPSTTISVSGIQTKSLESIDRSKISKFRKNIDTLFAPSLIEFAKTLIGGVGIKNDEFSKFSQIIKNSRGNLFSTAVEGGIFESAVQLGTRSLKNVSDFLSSVGDEQSPFDFEEGTEPASSLLKKSFGFSEALIKADAKRTASSKAVNTLIGKSLRDRLVKGQIFKKAASGYIPNFAQSPLEDAIGREKAAGVPINQIRINQSGKLRNSQNPMGLAVTNTRDEPTGRIPNFAARARYPAGTVIDGKKVGGQFKKVGDEAEKTASAFDSSIAKIFALQLAVGGITNAFSEQGGKMQEFGNSLSSAINTLLVLSTIGVSPLGIFGKGGGGIKGLAKLTKSTKGLTRVFGVLKGVAGPVALGLTALDLGLKAFTDKGILGYAKDGLVSLGVVASESSKKFAAAAEDFASRTANADFRTAFKEAMSDVEKEAKVLQAGVAAEDLTEGAVDFAKVSSLRAGQKVGVNKGITGLFPQDILIEEEQLKPVRDALGSLFVTSAEEIKKLIPSISDEQAKAFFDTQSKIVEDLEGQVIQSVKGGVNVADNIANATSSAKSDLLRLFVDVENFAEQAAKEIEEASEASLVLLQANLKNLRNAATAGSFAATGIEVGRATTILPQLTDLGSGEKFGQKSSITRSFAKSGDAVTLIQKELELSKALTTEKKLQLQAEIDSLNFTIKSREERFKITDSFVKGIDSLEKGQGIDEKTLKIIQDRVSLGDDLKEIQQALAAAGAELGGDAKEIFDLKLQELDTTEVLLSLEEQRLEAAKERREYEASTSFSDGLAKGMGELQDEVSFFQKNLGEDIPGQFSSNLGAAMQDAVSGAKDLDDALSDAGRNFLGFIRDAFLQQAANQLTSSLFGGGGGGAAGGGAAGGGGGFFSKIGGAVSGLFGGRAKEDPASAVAEGVGATEQAGGGGFFSKIGGAIGGLFGAGKKGVGSPGSSPTNPLFVQDVAGGIMGGGAGGAEKALEGIVGEGEGEGEEGFFSKLKSGFGDFFGGMKDKFGDIFGGLKDSLGGLFGGGAGGGGLLGGLGNMLGGIGGGLGGIFKGLMGGIGGIFGGIGSFFGFNKGGKVPSIKGFAGGGPVGSTDTVPAMLTPGEFVVKKSAVDKYGIDFLSSLNRGMLPMQGFQNGGSVSPVAVEAGSNAIGSSQTTNNSDFTFNIQDGQVNQEGGQASSENQREFAARIRSAVTTVIQEESRTGGSLNYLYKK